MHMIVVTGGAGFIGSNLVAALCARGTHKIVVCDRFGGSEKWRNLVAHPVHEVVAPDRLIPWLDANKTLVDAIFHMGGISSTTETDVDALVEQNFNASLRLWRWSIVNAKRFIYASSGSTFGDGEQGFDDNISLTYLRSLRPLNAYGWSKQMFDLHVASAAARNEPQPPQWAGLKFFNLYGPNEYHKDSQRSVVCQIAQHAIQGGTVKLFKSYNPQYPDGGQMRDFVYVRDAVNVMLWLLDHPQVKGIFNMGTGKARTFEDLAKAIFAALNRPPHIHYVDMPEHLVQKYQYFTQANMDRLRAVGYANSYTSLEDGVRDYVQSYLTKDDPYL